MGIASDDPFWDTYRDPRPENGGPPLETLLRGTEPPPAASNPPDMSDYDYGIPVPPPAVETPTPAPDDGQPPRIVATASHARTKRIWLVITCAAGRSSKRHNRLNRRGFLADSG